MPSQASAWLIAERARCRCDGLLFAKDLFQRHPFEKAMQLLDERVKQHEAVMNNPKPTGVAGE